MRNVVPGSAIKLEGALAHMLFGWEKMSVKPKEHTSGDDDPLPTYPFAGSFPEDGEDGIDLSELAKGLVLAEGALDARLYISLGTEFDDGGGWGDNLEIDLPKLEFYARYGKSENAPSSENLFVGLEPRTGTESWALSDPLGKILEDMTALENTADPNSKYAIVKDPENEDNPFKLYTTSELPAADKGIPVEGLRSALNRVLSGEMKGEQAELFFDYKVELAGGEQGEILLYPAMLEKTLRASADLLMLLAMQFKVEPHESEDPVIIEIDADLGGEDLFGRGEDDDGFFENIKFLGFEIASKNAIGLSAGKLFLENKQSNNEVFRREIFDFAAGGNLFLDEEELKNNKPFIPNLSLEFKHGDTVEVERSFAIKLQSITVKVGGEYTFETGL
jgi:hypothetical protein